MNPGTASLLELLAGDENARFLIPSWRRQYVWGTTDRDRREVERLWQDIRGKCREHGKHFCGVILLHKLENEGASTWELIDGQQRMATFFLLLMALRDVCEKRGVNCTDLNNLIRAGETHECRLVLRSEPCSDRRVMTALFRRSGFSLEQKIQDESKVYQAYRYLLTQIESEITSGSQEFLVNVLQGIEFRIQLENPTAQTRRAFETLDAQNWKSDAKVVVSEPPSRKPLTPAVARPPAAISPHISKKVVFALLGLFLAAIVIVWAIWWRDLTRVKTVYYQDITQRFGLTEGVGKLTEDQAMSRSISYKIESTRRKVFRVTEVNGSNHPVDDPARHHASTEELIYVEDSDHLSGITFLNHNGREVFSADFNGTVPGAAPDFLSQKINFKFSGRKPTANQVRNFSLLGERIYVNEADGKSGVTSEIVEYTKEGYPQHIQFRNSSGQPRADTSAIFGRDFEYDQAGRVVKISNLGQDDKLSPDKHGVASSVRTFDSPGNQVDETSLGLDGKPVLNESNYAKVVFKYDETGNKTGVSYFGIDGKPVFNKAGFASLAVKYDNRGNLIEQSCSGFNGEPVLNNEGYFSETLKYDPQGNVVEANFLGIDGKPVLTKDGYATEKLTHDPRGNIMGKTYFDIDGKPALNKNGYASESFKYDEHDNVIEAAGFGVDGLAVLGGNGYARVTFKYNDRNDKVEAAYFDQAGQPVLNKNGIACETFEYDANDNVVGQSYFGVEGQGVLNKDGAAKLAAKYDDRGNVLETACFGLDGNPALDKNGVAKETYKYDDRDNVIEAACFGIDGRATLDRGNVARAVFKFDDRGNKIESDYFDVEGNPTLNRGGFSRETFKYDDRGNTIEGAFFNNGGQLTLGPSGFARETLKYDERDRIIEAACFGAEGQPIEIGGAHQINYTYDSTGKISKTERLDRSGQPVP